MEELRKKKPKSFEKITFEKKDTPLNKSGTVVVGNKESTKKSTQQKADENTETNRSVCKDQEKSRYCNDSKDLPEKTPELYIIGRRLVKADSVVYAFQLRAFDFFFTNSRIYRFI